MIKPDINISNALTCRLTSTLHNSNMFYGFSYGGAMDVASALLANKILSQSLEENLIECALRAPRLSFNVDLCIAITGADMSWTLDDKTLAMNQVIEIKAGQVLSGKFAKNGFRSYIAFNKTIESMNATQILLGHTNKKLKIKSNMKVNDFFVNSLAIHRGPEWNLLTQNSKESMIVFEGKISQDIDCMGAYIDGPKLELKSIFPKRSVCTFPGVIQLLPDGQLIVLLQEAQTTGGYPRIAYIDKRELNCFNQLGPGQKIEWRLII